MIIPMWSHRKTSTAPRSGARIAPLAMDMRNPACSTWPHANRAVPSRFLASCFRNFAWDFELFLLKRWTFDAFGFFLSPTKVDSELVFDIRENPKLNIDLERPWPTKIIYKIISGQTPQAWPNSFRSFHHYLRSTAWKVKWLTDYPLRKHDNPKQPRGQSMSRWNFLGTEASEKDWLRGWELDFHKIVLLLNGKPGPRHGAA